MSAPGSGDNDLDVFGGTGDRNGVGSGKTGGTHGNDSAVFHPRCRMMDMVVQVFTDLPFVPAIMGEDGGMVRCKNQHKRAGNEGVVAAKSSATVHQGDHQIVGRLAQKIDDVVRRFSF